MKQLYEIQEVLDGLPFSDKTNYSGMTYENGIEEALRWVIGELKDEEFSYYKPCEF